MKQSFFYVIFFVLLLTISEIHNVNIRKSTTNQSILTTDGYEVNKPLDSTTSGYELIKPLPLATQTISVVNTANVVTPPVKTVTVSENQNETAVEFTLPELKIDETRKIESYYPYFYKTHIIEYQDSINYKTLTNDCRDPACGWCDTTTKMTCSECQHGYFLFNEKCYSSCPDGYVADIFKKKCVQIQNTVTHVVYVKAFTVGSCKNICGGKSSDCSCSPSCASSGSCCSDYVDCETLAINNLNKKEECGKKVKNCDMCSNLGDKCAQCKQGFYLRNGECVEKCFPSDKVCNINKICHKNQDCRVENCEECTDGNPAVCKKCHNGFFMHNNQCLDSCPMRYRADRISWVCLEAPVSAWYWVFPSVTSCSKRCGVVVSQDMDCSCSDDCFRYGNCCQDIEDFCPQFIFWT